MEILKAQTFNQALCSIFSTRTFDALLSKFSQADKDKNTISNLQRKLADVSFKYNAVFNSSENYCIVLDRHLNVVDFNDRSVGLIKKVFGKKLVVGEYVGHYLTGELAEPIMENCMRALRGDTFIVERKVAFTKDDCQWWQAEYSPAYNDMQHIAGMVFNATEISTRKVKEAKIEQQNEKLKAISLMQSHEIRSPVCTMLGLLDLMKLEGITDTTGYLQHMEATVNLLDKKIKEIVECANELG